MHRLRTLISLIFLLSPALSFALTQSIGISVEGDSRQGPLDIADLNRQFNVNQTSQKITYQATGVLGALNPTVGFQISQPDYSSVTVLDDQANPSPLSNQIEDKPEYLTDLGVEWVSGANTLSLGWLGHVSESPFGLSSFKLDYSRSFFSQTSTVGMQATYAEQDQPESFYVDPDFRIHARPNLIRAYEVGLWYEQVLTENWKTRHKFSSGQRIEERPRNVAVEGRQAVALSDTLFAELQYFYATELHTQVLKNERGYFDSRGFTVGLTIEPIFDLLLSASYGLVWETEDDPRIERRAQVLSDQYGFGASYALTSFDLQMQGAYVVSNSNIKNIRVSGGVTWKL